MNSNKIFELINLYFDAALDKNQESLLFTELSKDSGARKHFRLLSRIKAGIEESIDDFPEELDERILRSVSRTPENKFSFFTGQKLFASVSYAIAVLLIVLSGYLFMKVSAYQEKVDNLSEQMNFQTRTIQMLFNSLPGVEIRTTLDNEILIKPNS